MHVPIARSALRRRILVIEGDGPDWPAPDRAPRDPTPYPSVALAFAHRMQRTVGADTEVVYLGRPCQYRGRYRGESCESRWWSTDRYGEPVLAAYQQLLDAMQRIAPAPLCLVGYSGGGLMALLLAGQRSDVAGVMTIASPIAFDAWTAHHRLTPLPVAQDLARGIEALPGPRQAHFLGGQDTVVPISAVLDETRALVGASRVLVVAGARHEGPWAPADDPPRELQGPLSMPISAWCAEGS